MKKAYKRLVLLMMAIVSTHFITTLFHNEKPRMNHLPDNRVPERSIENIPKITTSVSGYATPSEQTHATFLIKK